MEPRAGALNRMACVLVTAAALGAAARCSAESTIAESTTTVIRPVAADTTNPAAMLAPDAVRDLEATVADSTASAAATPEWAGIERLEIDAERDLDASALAELEALLLDPVDVRRGDFERLSILPGIGPEQLRGLRAARELRSRGDIARLPGWDGESARVVAPFLRFAPAPASRGRSWTLQAARRSLSWRAAGRATGIVLRVPVRDRRPQVRTADDVTACARWERAGVRALAGDVRLSHAQGLLLWTGEGEMRAGAEPWRQAHALQSLEGASHAHALRGGGVQVARGGARLAVTSGRHETGHVWAVSAVRDLSPRLQLQAAACGVGNRRAGSVGGVLTNGEVHVAFEAAGVRRALGLALALQARRDDLRLRLRLQSTPAGMPAPLAAGRDREDSRGALVLLRWRASAFDPEVSLAQERRRDAFGAHIEAAEIGLRIQGTLRRTVSEVRWRWRAVRREDVLEEGLGARQERCTRLLEARLRRPLDRAWTLGLAYVGRDVRQAAAVADSIVAGTALQARLERDAPAWSLHLAFTTFRSQAASASLAEPGLPPTGGAPRLQGDGMRLSSSLRWRRSHLEARIGVVQQWTAARGAQQFTDAALTLRHP